MSQSAGVAALRRGAGLRVGDVLLLDGSDHTITRLEPYPSAHLFDFMDDRWRVAYSGDWCITIDPNAQWYRMASGAWAP